MKSDRDIEKMVAQMGLKRSTKKAVVQYTKGMQDGMRLAYVAVARRMLAGGQSLQAVQDFFGGLVKKNDLRDILEEARSGGAG